MSFMFSHLIHSLHYNWIRISSIKIYFVEYKDIQKNIKKTPQK